MFKQAITYIPMMNLVLIGQVLFFAIFAVSIAWVFRKDSARFYEQLAAMPLENGSEHE